MGNEIAIPMEQLKKHKCYSELDYLYLRANGWSDMDIVERWDKKARDDKNNRATLCHRLKFVSLTDENRNYIVESIQKEGYN